MRINFWGGPGCGKSTVAPYIFAELKRRNFNVESVNEYVKGWVYLKRNPEDLDQNYIFAKQLHSEHVKLRNGVQHIVSDSPLLMSAWYCRKFCPEIWHHILGIAQHFEIKQPSVNIFLNRTGISYQQGGRFQDEKEARAMDKDIFEFAYEYSPNLVEIKTIDTADILNHILDALGRT